MMVSCSRETTAPRIWRLLVRERAEGEARDVRPPELEGDRLEDGGQRERADEPGDVGVGRGRAAAGRRPARARARAARRRAPRAAARRGCGGASVATSVSATNDAIMKTAGVGEVQDVEDAEDERVAEREQRVDAAQEQPVDDLLPHARLRSRRRYCMIWNLPSFTIWTAGVVAAVAVRQEGELAERRGEVLHLREAGLDVVAPALAAGLLDGLGDHQHAGVGLGANWSGSIPRAFMAARNFWFASALLVPVPGGADVARPRRRGRRWS